MMANNKTNKSVHPQKTLPSSKGQNHAGGGATYHLPPHQIEPKPSPGSIVHGVCMTPVCLVGLPRGLQARMVEIKAAGHHDVPENIPSFAPDTKNLGYS
jgi:hypothetical protein